MDRFWKIFTLGSIVFVLACFVAVYCLYPQNGGYAPSGTSFEELNITVSSWNIHVTNEDEKIFFNDLSEAVDYSEEYSEKLVESFNSRYDTELEPIPVYLTNESYNYFYVSQKSIYLAEENPNLLEKGYVEYVTAHETCHYFENYGCNRGDTKEIWESICEIYANRSHTANECQDNDWPLIYCSPFRLNEVNRQEFLDCVFEDACEEGATNENLASCYAQNKREMILALS